MSDCSCPAHNTYHNLDMFSSPYNKDGHEIILGIKLPFLHDAIEGYVKSNYNPGNDEVRTTIPSKDFIDSYYKPGSEEQYVIDNPEDAAKVCADISYINYEIIRSEMDEHPDDWEDQEPTVLATRWSLEEAQSLTWH